MASITRYEGGWRAHLCVGGVRKSKAFRTRREAAEWAERTEVDLVGGSQLTFAAATERFLRLKLPKLDNADNQRVYEQSLRDHVLPEIGTKKLENLTRRDLVAVVRKVAESGRVETAHRIGQRIRAVLDHAIDCGDIQSHAAAGLSRVLPSKSPVPRSAISLADLPELLQAISSYPEPVTRIGLLLLAHTFVRTSELTAAKWSELKDDVWLIPAERMKRRIPHVVPLSSHVLRLLKELEPMTGDSPYILASKNLMSPISNNTMLFALYRLGYRGRMTGHGFRAIASTALNESGLWSRDAIEKQLAHRETDRVREVYHRAAYLEERARMMAWYSAHLGGMSGANVS